MIAELVTRPCTIVSRGADVFDENGDLSKTESSVSALCELQPTKGDEIAAGNLGVETYNLYLVGSHDLNADDAILVDSARYELVGDAAPRRNPRSGETPFTYAVVRRVR